MDERYLTTEEIAEVYRVKPSTIGVWITRDAMPYHGPQKSRRFLRSETDPWFASLDTE